jgi:Uma2 family endonuclease
MESGLVTLEAGTRIAADAYFDLPEYTQHDLIQLIDGEVVIGMPPNPYHQAVVGNLHVIFWSFAREHGGRAFIAPVEVMLDEHNVYEPDVLYLAPESRCVIEEQRLVGPPDLVVEVLSPSTAKHDREHEFSAYQGHGVREYWIADPANRTLEIWMLRDGIYVKSGTFVPGETFDSTVLAGQPIPVADLFHS